MTSFIRSTTLALLAGAVSATVAVAQAPARYEVAPDSLHYVLDNPFRMYWMRGSDTVGRAQRSRSAESHVWRGTATRPEVVIRQLTLDVNRRLKTDTFSLTPQGQVMEINHRSPTSSERVDLLLRLPSAPLRLGTQWVDTVRNEGTDAAGKQWYEVVRSYRVTRFVDTLGVRGVAEVAASGAIQFRFGFWVDSAAGRAAWIDVKGPVTERYLFDVGRGRLLRRRWDMDLRGRGVSPTGTDTLPAGLRSSETIALTDAAGVRFLLAPLPGADTAMTMNVETSALILLHTVDRRPGSITASLSRNDGTVGVTGARFAGTDLVSYDAVWVDTATTLSTRRITLGGGKLLVSHATRDSVVDLPASGRWGVADYAMEELLAPMLLALPRDGEAHPISVFRPYPGHWDTGAAVALERGGVVLLVIRYAGSEQTDALVFTPEGDLLFAESGGAGKSRRVAINAARQARLQAALPALRGGE